MLHGADADRYIFLFNVVRLKLLHLDLWSMGFFWRRWLDHRMIRVAHDHDADTPDQDHVYRADQRVWRYEQRNAAIDLRR